MEKISSFTIDHNNLLSGLYMSRKDKIDNVEIITFDLRFTRPNHDSVMTTKGIHAIEHLGATYLRNTQKNIIYFGPMGCRTGFYLIVAKVLNEKDILEMVKKMLEFIISFEGDIPGCSEKDCGNYTDMSLLDCKNYCKKYLNVLKKANKDNLIYNELR